MKILTVGKNDAGQRLDKFLTKSVKGLPTALMYRYIREKKIQLNRKRAKPQDFVAEGDAVWLFIRDEFFDVPEKDTGALFRIHPKPEIVYEDENILLLNKRPGVLCHEDEEGGENTLLLHLQAYLAQKGEYDPNSEQSFAPALCNRIDRNTGGIVIAAKNAEALRVMNERIKERSIDKKYLCLCHGIPAEKEAILSGFLRKNEKTNTVEVRDTFFAGAKEIKTGYRVIGEEKGNALLEVTLYTGRTHQIRAHLSHIGHPLLGDGKYGVNREEKRDGFKYQALYSYALTFLPDGKENLLSYLNGKTFSLGKKDVWFLSEENATEKKPQNRERIPVQKKGKRS